MSKQIDYHDDIKFKESLGDMLEFLHGSDDYKAKFKELGNHADKWVEIHRMLRDLPVYLVRQGESKCMYGWEGNYSICVIMGNELHNITWDIISLYEMTKRKYNYKKRNSNRLFQVRLGYESMLKSYLKKEFLIDEKKEFKTLE